MNSHILGPDAFDWQGTSYRTIMASADSDGAMSVVDSVSPVGAGLPRHVHGAEDEALVVLSGECEIWVDGRTFLCGPGETAYVPRGTEHSFRVVGDQPSRHLTIRTPGGLEAFFAEMAESQLRIPEDMAKVTAAASRHSLTFTGSPSAASNQLNKNQEG